MTGYYNLPKEEQDKYNVEMTHEDLQSFYQKTIKAKIKRTNKILAPILDESLLLYITRLRVNLGELDEQANQEHLYGPKGPWYVHKRAQNCFICDYSTMNNQTIDILMDLTQLLPKKLLSRLAFASLKEGSHRLALTP